MRFLCEVIFAVAGGPATAPFTVPLRRQELPSTDGVTVSYRVAYSGPLEVGVPVAGQPRQRLHVVFDSGSAHLIVPSVHCVSSACLGHQRYHVASSQSGIAIDADGTPVSDGDDRDEIQVGFGTGSITGVFASDVTCVSGVCIPQHLVTATEMSAEPFSQFEFDGILGLGMPALSTSPQFSYLHQLHSAGYDPVFAVWLSRDSGHSSQPGEVTFGGFRTDRLSGPLVWVPVADRRSGLWEVEISAIRIAGALSDICDTQSCFALLDTGSSLVATPAALLDDIGEVLQDHTIVEDKHGRCSSDDALTIDLDLDGLTLVLTPDEFARPVVGANSSGLCDLALMKLDIGPPLGPNVVILGEPFLRKHYVVFDHANQRIGFGLAVAALDHTLV
mmetsp:Transcript_52759/g.115705  ORF Transcript_52759/g.115705 Transcript_52759/m.115705 type:complete len:389 (+) Transcript_52759:202-1368(+)|eukprot:CAMPEP_0204276478 /NCGR_PEP_ID=MMETSP0468-20130131/28180_1 /ASSEMBLY_ACC=CAM_ASM_000383 /TAXON_ID=2969 /ORGANISM="Oxyrrhis marina" /LENGTH=388 /DNA_ID=CAMNT_0051253087 /DNA_START=162 /DNA_END=1328 /DNA_ORIENTATION=-